MKQDRRVRADCDSYRAVSDLRNYLALGYKLFLIRSVVEKVVRYPAVGFEIAI